MKKQNTLKILLMLSLLTLMTACGKHETDGSEESLSSYDTSSTSYIQCHQASSYGSQMTVNIRSVYANEKIRGDLMRLKFTMLTNNFTLDSNYIQMFRWKVSADGVVSLDSTPLSFRAESLSSGAIMTNFATSMKWSDLTYARQNQNSSTIGDLITKIRFTVNTKDTTSEYQALKIVLYTSNGSIIDQTDMLMPVFSAHPSAYAVTPSGGARPSTLQAMHPFRQLAAQGYTATQILNHSNDFCF